MSAEWGCTVACRRVGAVAALGVGMLAAGCAAVAPAGTVLYASGADLQSINPLFTIHPLAKQVQRYVLFTTLARYDSALAPRPYLARRWEFSPDGRVLDVEIRRDVPWHDGQPTTADDVAFTLEAARDPATGYPRAADLADLVGIERRDSFGVRLRFAKPRSGFPDVLTDLAILPAHLLAGVPRAALRTHGFNRNPVGNGPFRFVAHQPNRRWIFERNPDFPATLGGPPLIGRLVIVVVDEATTKLAALTSGELDVAGILPMHADLIRRDRRLKVVSYPVLFTYALVWNTRRPPFGDPALRRALTLALDRRAIVRAYLHGYGEVAGGPVPSAHPLSVPVEPVPFDRAASRALLDSLGWAPARDGVRAKAGHRLAFDLFTVGSADNALEQMIQRDLAAVGAEARIRQLELGAFLALAQGPSRDYDALVTGLPGDLALGYLAALFDSARLGGPLQYAQYGNPEMDRLLRAGDWAAVQRLAARELPVSFLYHARGVQGASRRLLGVRMDLRGELAEIARWSLAEETSVREGRPGRGARAARGARGAAR